jgi:hypothetical protein
MNAIEIVDSLMTRHILFKDAVDPGKRKNDLLTSLRKLASALDVPLETIDLSSIEATYEKTLKSYFARLDPLPSVHTQRNTFQNLTQLYRAAYEAGYLRANVGPHATRGMMRQYAREFAQTSPYRSRANMSTYKIPKAQWPAAIRDPWEACRLEKSFDIRQETLTMYEGYVSGYVSYGLAFETPPIATWDQLFETPRLRRYIQWLATRVDESWTKTTGATGRKTRTTTRGYWTAKQMVLLAHYLKRPEAPALVEFTKKLPRPERFHQKTDPVHAVSFRELEDIGLRLLAQSREPFRVRDRNESPGARYAIRCQTGLLIRLWWRIPIRSRSMREMDIRLPGVHVPQPRLYQDDEGTWQLRYQGEQLKIGERRGRVNEFRVPFPPDLVAHLEEYLRDFRPLIPNADRNPLVFLSQIGTGLKRNTIWMRLAHTVYAFSGKRIYPHLLRTMWTDQYLLASNGDVDTAAYWLNDTPATVLEHYHELVGERQIAKAYAFNDAILGNGKVNGKGKARTPHPLDSKG